MKAMHFLNIYSKNERKISHKLSFMQSTTLHDTDTDTDISLF